MTWDFTIQMLVGDGWRIRAQGPEGQVAFGELDHETLLRVASSGTSLSDDGLPRTDKIRIGKSEDARSLGRLLYSSVLQGQVETLFEAVRGAAERENHRVRLRFCLADQGREFRWLQGVPWEFLYSPVLELHLALDRRFSIVRFLEYPAACRIAPLQRPIKALAVAPCPKGCDLANKDETSCFQQLLEGSAWGQVDHLRPATELRLRRELVRSEGRYSILHFAGHGNLDHRTGEGFLSLESEAGEERRVRGEDLAIQLSGLRQPRLVILNACDSGCPGHNTSAEPFHAVAQALVRVGVPAVVAMRRSISDLAAQGFSSAFYQSLVDTDDVESAVTEARIVSGSCAGAETEWSTPVLFLRTTESLSFRAEEPISTGTGESSGADRATTRFETDLDLGRVSGRAHEITLAKVKAGNSGRAARVRGRIDSLEGLGNKVTGYVED